MFLREDLDLYKRRIDPVGHYMEQTAFYISKTEGVSYEEAYQFVREETLKELEVKKQPMVRYYQTLDTLDKVITETPLLKYIYNVLDNGEILAPTFTTYIHTSKKKSILSEMTAENVKLRSVHKKASHAAKARGEMEVYVIEDLNQNNRKTENNALSGTYGTKGTPLYNPTAHTTLTSTTRMVASNGNAHNEKMIAGNRHYYHLDIILYNLISITSSLGDKNDVTSYYAKINNVIDKYGLHKPSTEDVLTCILRSSELYFGKDNRFKLLTDFIDNLDYVEKAAFVYIGDLYHLRHFNEVFVRNFITRLSDRVVIEQNGGNKDIIKQVSEGVTYLAHQICADDIKGMGKDYDLMDKNGVLNVIAGTSKNINSVLMEHQDIIDAFYKTDNMPSSIAYIATMMRRVVVLSDTDSTCASLGEWVKWHRGYTAMDQASFGLAGSVLFMATQSLVHNLATLSANFNVDREHLHTLEMKNEFFWSSVTVALPKHYYALTHIQEGSVFAKPELERKGVHLKSSNTPKSVMDLAEKVMEEICYSVYTRKPISHLHYLKLFADMERKIIQSLTKGEVDYYREIKIKDHSAYTQGPTKSNYRHYTMWKEVFEPKYGECEKPPYMVAKIPINVNNKTEFNNWLEQIQDRNFMGRLRNWLNNHDKNDIATFYLPSNKIVNEGLPEEFKDIVAVNDIVLDLCNVFYLLLGTLGFYKKPGYTLIELGY